MQDSILAPWRDLSIIILIIPTMILALVPGAIFYFAIRGARWLKRSIRNPLLSARLWALRIQHGTDRASRATVALPIAVEGFDARLRATARGIGEFLGIELR
jgi:hypothetical protein